MSLTRRSLQVFAFICTLVVGTASMAVIVTQTTWFKEWLRGFIVRQADDYVNGRLTIGRLDGNLFFGVEMEDVDITMNGKPVVALKDVGLDYNLLTFIRGYVVLDHIRLNKPTLHVEKTAKGWNLGQLVKAQTPNPNTPKNRRPIEIGEIGISDGTLYLEGQPVGTSGVDIPKVVDKIDASIGVSSDENELKVAITHVALRGQNPEVGLNDLSGIIRRHEDSITIEDLSLRTEETSLRLGGSIRNIDSGNPVINVKASSDKFAMKEAAALMPVLRGYENLQPAFEINASGPADRLDVQLNVREKQIGEVAGNLIVDAVGPERRIAGDAQTKHFNVGAIVQGATVKTDVTGRVEMDLVFPSAATPMRGTYTIDASRAVVAGYEARHLKAKGRIDGRIVTLDADAAAYGAHATATGTVRAEAPLALDLAGRASNLDLRKLPPQLRAPAAPSNLRFSYTLAGRGPALSGDVQMEDSTLADATIAKGTAGSFSIGNGAPAYSARGQVAHLDLQKIGHGFDIPLLDNARFQSRINLTAFDLKGIGGGQYPLTLDATGTVVDSEIFGAAVPHVEFTTNLGGGEGGSLSSGDGAPVYSAQGRVANLDLQKIGQGLDLPALDNTRFQSRINLTAFDVKGTGGGQYPLTLDATGAVVDSEIFGAAVPHLEFTTNLGGGDAHVISKGQFTGLDPAAIAGDNRVAGKVDGDVDVNVTLRDYASGVTVDSIDATGRVDMGHSTIGGLDIDKAVVDGSYTNRSGTLNELVIDGPDLHANGRGSIALNDSGSSDLTVHVETPSLDRLARLVGPEEIKGGAIVDATVTGNGQELKVQGTLDGSNMAFRDNSALDLDSTFDAAVPQLTLADATIHAKTNATFVQVAGQQVNELVADTTYSQSKLDFNAVAKQGVRQLAADGSVMVHPDHREIHVGNLALQAEQIVWRTDPASHPTIQYGNNRVVVDDIRLVNADQLIEARGSVGSPSDMLHVQTRNVDVAQLDALMLGDQRLSGRLNANATVSGTTAAPRVEGDFALTQGAFRNFKFESFGGKVDYAARGLTIDVRLDQNPQSWITAKGFAPVTLFQPTPPDLANDHREPPAGEAINIAVASSQIDLGVVQGFTSYVTNVTGVMQANLKVTGSGYDPHLDGAIDIKGGAFTAPDLGMSYTGLDTRIDLKPDAVTISQFKILDDDKNPLTIGGSLAVHERAVGAVDVTMQSDNFKVIKNNVADVKFDSDVHITGTIRAPKVEGTIEVGPSTINVADVLETATSTAYSTTATEISPISPVESAGPEPTTPAVPGVFDAVNVRLSLAIPGDLLLKGNNIKPANAPIDVGDMNVYVGGAVNIIKAPHEKIRISGEVNTIRGSYNFQGRRFDILRDGRVRFQGSDVIDPLMDLQARRVISGVETFIHVQGTMRQPELSFRSNPPLEEAEILSLIVFNMPINELGEGQQVSLALRAQELAGGYLASGLSQSIGDALNLDEFEIQAAGERGLGPSITIGQQIGKGVFVRLRQGFAAEQATEFILEYQLAQYLRLQGTLADVSGSTQRNAFRRVERGGLDLIFFFSY